MGVQLEGKLLFDGFDGVKYETLEDENGYATEFVCIPIKRNFIRKGKKYLSCRIRIVERTKEELIEYYGSHFIVISNYKYPGLKKEDEDKRIYIGNLDARFQYMPPERKGGEVKKGSKIGDLGL